MAPKPTSWGPYRDEGEARQCLGAFAARVVGPGTGVIFCDGMGATYLTRPFYDADGNGLVLVATTTAPGHAPPQPPSGGGVWQRIEAFLHDTLTRMGEAQIAGADAQLAASQQEVRLIKQGWSSLHDFVDEHKTVFDGVATGGDVFGVIAGVVTIVAFSAGAVAALPAALAITAGVVSAALLARDGQLFWAELNGDEARKREIEDSPVYRTIELVGPLLILPDLLVSGPRAVMGLSKTATELGETREAVSGGREMLDAAREDLAGYKEAHGAKLDRPNIKTRVQARQARVNKLRRALEAAQDRVHDAQKEFYLLRGIELPAYAGAVYSEALTGASPPYLADPSHWHSAAASTRPSAVCTPASPHGFQEGENVLNPMRLLVPPRGWDAHLQSGHGLSFQVALGHNPAAARP